VHVQVASVLATKVKDIVRFCALDSGLVHEGDGNERVQKYAYVLLDGAVVNKYLFRTLSDAK